MQKVSFWSTVWLRRKKIIEAKDPLSCFGFFLIIYYPWLMLMSENSKSFFNSQMLWKARSHTLDFWHLQLIRQLKKKQLSNGGTITVFYAPYKSTTHRRLNWINFVGGITHVRKLFPWVKPWKILGYKFLFSSYNVLYLTWNKRVSFPLHYSDIPYLQIL